MINGPPPKAGGNLINKRVYGSLKSSSISNPCDRIPLTNGTEAFSRPVITTINTEGRDYDDIVREAMEVEFG